MIVTIGDACIVMSLFGFSKLFEKAVGIASDKSKVIYYSLLFLIGYMITQVFVVKECKSTHCHLFM